MNCNTCEWCGQQFNADKPSRKYCCRQCYLDAIEASKAICQHCGKTYKPKKPDRNKYCSRKCAFEAKRAQGRGIEPVFISVCLICGEHVDRVNGYCSDECRKEMARIKERERAVAQYEPRQRKCRGCGATFVSEYGDKRRFFCGDSCRRKHSRRIARQRNGRTLNERARKKLRIFYGKAWRGYYEPINAGAVFERDGWTCQLCGCKVKQTKEYHPRQATVDHIVPLAAGGPHWYDNVQAACMECNTAKGDGEGARWSGATP